MQFSARVVGVELVIKHKDILMGGGGGGGGNLYVRRCVSLHFVWLPIE